MRGRLFAFGAAGLFVTAAALAEPAKAPVQKAAQPADQRAEVVVASADNVPPANTGGNQVATPAKKVRKARVIDCRCGDPAAQE